MEQNIFFYRDRDKNCEQVYFLIKNNGFLNYFKCINVDITKPNIKAVPALLIYKLKQILYGQEIYIFLNNLIQQQNIKQQQINLMRNSINNSIRPITPPPQNTNQTQTNPQIIQQNIQQQNINRLQQNKSNIIGYIESEMNGFSDSYTFSSPDINILPQHNFTGSNENIKIYTGNDTTKIKTSDTVKTIQKIKELRLNENKQLKDLQYKSQQNKQNQDEIKRINNQINEFVKKHQNDSIK